MSLWKGTRMSSIEFQSEATLQADPGTTLLEAALKAELPIAHACGGNGRCSTCRVLVTEGLDHLAPRNAQEQRVADLRKFTPQVRLACQTRLEGDVKLRRLVLDEVDQRLVDEELAGAICNNLGEERKLAILFADVRGFTSFSEAHLPYDIVHILNRYFARVEPIISANGGRIDNFMGDGLMALFGVEGEPDVVPAAVKAGLEMLAAVEQLRPYYQAHFGIDFRIGIGIHAGTVVLGTIGSGERRRLTAIGDAVNLASRIESANKEAGTELLVSEDAFAQIAGRVQAGRRFELQVKGKSGHQQLVEVLGQLPSEKG